MELKQRLMDFLGLLLAVMIIFVIPGFAAIHLYQHFDNMLIALGIEAAITFAAIVLWHRKFSYLATR